MSSLLAESRAADPLLAPWGFYLAPVRGSEGLHWFATEAALVAFVRDELWKALAGVEPEPGLKAEWAALLEGPAPLRWERLDSINLLLEPLGQLHWWGNLRQLYEGEDPFARDLRELWRAEVGRGPRDYSALAPEDARAFADFLRRVFNNTQEGKP